MRRDDDEATLVGDELVDWNAERDHPAGRQVRAVLLYFDRRRASACSHSGPSSSTVATPSNLTHQSHVHSSSYWSTSTVTSGRRRSHSLQALRLLGLRLLVDRRVENASVEGEASAT
jgi:hypothetical protein